MNTEDTIVAVATPPGEGGIGVVRLSGTQSLPIVRTLSRRLDKPTEALLGALAHLEALIDFVEDDVPPAQEEAIAARLAGALDDLRALLATADAGIILREGVRAVLAGKPNVGKSSLLNALLRVDRAIVTPIAGTTRDTVEEPVNIRDVPVYLVDTAGLTETADPVGRIGVARSRQALAFAGLGVLVLGGSQPLGAGDRGVAASVDALPEWARLVLAV